jgi:molybdopterin-containing oxidoreductase family membrane subunit
MLTEVIFCITCYAIVLVIEFLPIILENRKLQEIKPLRLFGHNLHEIMAVFALLGTFLSFFHQGSLGGVAGVLFARPFAFREGFFVWPWTFFLFTLSAIACGPGFTALVCRIIESASGKKLVDRSVYELIAKICGVLLLVYVVLKTADTLYWALATAPAYGFTLMDFYSGPYGIWLLITEIVICGALPVVVFLTPQLRENGTLLFAAFALNCVGITINRFVMSVQTTAVPSMDFDQWAFYVPTWAEWGPCIAMFAYIAFILSLAYRYLPMFPQEKELNAS